MKKKREGGKAVVRLIDRVFGLFLAAGIVLGIFGLALEWVLLKGPSPALRDSFVMTMIWTRRFDFIPRIFLTKQEVDDIFDSHFVMNASGASTDTSLITVKAEEEIDPDLGPQPDAYGLIDEDGDGIVIVDVKKKGFVGKMMVVYDPSRIIVGKPEVYGGYGMPLDALCERYGAIGGINGGAFYDEDGSGTGGFPDGLTISDGEYTLMGHERTFVGFDENNILFVGDIDEETAKELHMRCGVSFGPALIINGVGEYGGYMESGINPRTAIGQRADGAVLMLVIDGRQIHSIGCSFGDARDVMIDFGAVNACNLDGGSSTVMYLNGQYINSPSSASGTSRNLPNGFLIK
ncbi:MAG: phosphodiester glycosidase family protein [Oscillospiraceae bacterium]|nr:phosphodiester glycosidase family protein [Oscillospiraceae bacterium]